MPPKRAPKKEEPKVPSPKLHSPKLHSPKKITPKKSSINYSSLSVSELKELLKQRGIKDSQIPKEGKTVLKGDRIKALENYDNLNKTLSPPKSKKELSSSVSKKNTKKSPTPKNAKKVITSESDEDTIEMDEDEIKQILEKERRKHEALKKKTPERKVSKSHTSPKGVSASKFTPTSKNMFLKNTEYGAIIYMSREGIDYPYSFLQSINRKQLINALLYEVGKTLPSEDVREQVLDVIKKHIEGKKYIIKLKNSPISTIVLTRIFKD